MPDTPNPKPEDNPFYLDEAAHKHLRDTMPDMFAKGYIIPAPEPEPEPPRLSLRPPETIDEYTDANLYPVTTKVGMSFEDQADEDLEWMRIIFDYLEGDGQITAKMRMRAALLELLCKVPALVTLMKTRPTTE
jgi:hypothetical protein